MAPKRKAPKGVEPHLPPRPLTRRAAAGLPKPTEEQLVEASSQNTSVGKPTYLKVTVVLDNDGSTMDRYVEESLLAFVDFSQPDSQTSTRSDRGSSPSTSAGKKQDAIEDTVDDTLMFFEEVFCHSIGSASAAVPTRGIQAAVFKCLKESRSIELAVKSFKLLDEFRKTFPCIRTRETSSPRVLELVLNVKAWTPFQSSEGDDCLSEKRFTSSGIEEDPSQQAARAVLLSDHMTDEHLNWHEFFRRIADCMEAYGGISSPNEEDRTAQVDRSDLIEDELELGEFLTFEYVVDILEMDFNCRLIHFEANHELEVLQCSYVRKLLKLQPQGSGRNAARELVGHLLRIICACGRQSGGKIASLPCVSVRHICELARKLIIMFTKLGECEQDFQRSNLKEIVDDFPDDAEMLNSFLQTIQDSRHKMDFILRQLARKWPKQVQVNHGLADLLGSLECLANKTQAKLVCRAFGAETLEVLLGHAFQAALWLQDSGGEKSTNDLCLAFQAALEMHQAHQKLNLDELHPTVTFSLILAKSVCNRIGLNDCT